MPVPDKESQKKMIGELLKNADKHIKSAEWNKALDEVGKALAIEPNNMYALAYKDRINGSIAEEKKKAEEEKVKKLSEDQKKSTETAKDEKKQEPVKEEKKQEEKKSEEKKTEEKKPEEKKEEKKGEPAKQETKPSANAKDDSAARVDSLRQEFSATQAKLQREVAQLTMQVKEAQALKEATEKTLNGQIVALQQQLTDIKHNASKADHKDVDALKKEIETLKSKHQKELDSAREIVKAENLAQIATMQKELEVSKASASPAAMKAQGEAILRTMFQKAWKDGTISNDERQLMEVLKSAIEMPDQKFAELEKSTKGEAYVSALRSVWSDGLVTPEESDFLQSLRDKLGIPADEHFKLESQIRKELKK
ncbi:MAG: hypothetical protein HYV29_13990 [Ignavibacteriales bacterium]|nr:hypothetical protein [Ignavibacteriales bacterium]